MKIGVKLTLSFLSIGVLVTVLGVISLYQLTQLSEPISNEIPLQISELELRSDLDAHAQLIRYYDEVLTQSARNYAFTLDEKWKQRYSDTVPLLDGVIKHSIEYGDIKEKEFFESVNLANVALIEMETKSMTFADTGDREQAVAILESDEYWNQKAIYEKGLKDYVLSRGLDYDEALISSALTLEQVTKNTQDILNFGTNVVLLFVVITIASALFLGFVMSKSITKPIVKLNEAVKKIESGKSDVKINPIYSENELSELIQSFNTMSDAIKKNLELEKELAISNEKIKNEKFTTIGLLSSRLSHDLRNPLAVIKGSIELLKAKDQNRLNDEHMKNYVRLDEAIKSMVHQIEDVLTFVQQKPLDLHKTLVSNLIKNSLEYIEIPSTIKINLPSDDFELICDKRKLEVVLYNVVANAIQAMSNEGTLSLRIKQKNEFVTIEIEDSGDGVPDHLINKVFDPLFTTKSLGTGLGLSTCKSIVEQHGGNITVQNKPSIFSIILPVNLRSELDVIENKE